MAARPQERAEVRESLISAGLAIEGKINGTGNVRIAGHFKGDANVDGNLSIEPGAKHQGEVRAGSVTVGGELPEYRRPSHRHHGHRRRGRRCQGGHNHGGLRFAHARARGIRLGRQPPGATRQG